jgi:hypothetical protein
VRALQDETIKSVGVDPGLQNDLRTLQKEAKEAVEKLKKQSSIEDPLAEPSPLSLGEEEG